MDVVRAIQETVADYHGMSVELMLSRRRTREIVYARQEAMALCRELLPELSFPRIGKKFGGLDHTTVMYACERVAKREADGGAAQTVMADLRLRCRRIMATVRAQREDARRLLRSDPIWRFERLKSRVGARKARRLLALRDIFFRGSYCRGTIRVLEVRSSAELYDLRRSLFRRPVHA